MQGEVVGDCDGQCGDGAGEFPERSACSGFEGSFVAEAGVRVLDLVASPVAASPGGCPVWDVLIVVELAAAEGGEAVAAVLSADVAMATVSTRPLRFSGLLYVNPRRLGD